MNLVLDEAEEVHMKSKNRKSLGEMEASLIEVLYVIKSQKADPRKMLQKF